MPRFCCPESCVNSSVAAECGGRDSEVDAFCCMLINECGLVKKLQKGIRMTEEVLKLDSPLGISFFRDTYNTLESRNTPYHSHH